MFQLLKDRKAENIIAFTGGIVLVCEYLLNALNELGNPIDLLHIIGVLQRFVVSLLRIIRSKETCFFE